MSSGRLSRVDMESRVYKLYYQLEEEEVSLESKLLAKKYLWKVLDMVKEYSQ